MHYLVRMLVEADTAKEALENAASDCDIMVEYQYIDWYDMNGRWGDSKAYGVNSAKGKKLLAEGMENNRKDFDRALEAIRYMFDNFTDDQIYNENFTKTDQHASEHYLSRYQFTIAAGKTNAACVYAMGYNMWGDRVHHDKDLEYILENNKDKKLWVVPVDVHN